MEEVVDDFIAFLADGVCGVHDPCANAYDYDGADELEQAQRDHKTASAAHDEMVLAGREMSEVRDLPREIRFQ